MSTASKHVDGSVESDRPAKRVRVSGEAEDEDELEDGGTPPKAREEPQKASDLYLDTVGLVCHAYTLI